MDSLKVEGVKCLMVRRLIIRNQLKPAHLLSTHFRDKKRDLNMSQEADEAEDDEMFEQVEVNKQDGLGSQDNDPETGSAHEHQKELLDNNKAAASPAD